MTDTNDNALVTATYERKVIAVRVATPRAVEPGEVIVWYADDNVQRIVSAQEFDQHFAGVTPAALDTPPDVATGKKEADQAAKEDAALASHLQLYPTKKRQSTRRVISVALHVLHSAEKNENGYTGITARRIIDSGLADYVLASAKQPMIQTCNTLKSLVDAGHATRRVDGVLVQGRLRPVYHYAPAGAPAEAVPVPTKADTVYRHAPARAWPVTPRMREKTR